MDLPQQKPVFPKDAVLALRSAVKDMMESALADGYDTYGLTRRLEQIASVMAREIADEWRKGAVKRKMAKWKP